MTTDPPGPSWPAPTSADAARILAEIAPVAQRSQRLTRDVALGVPLLGIGDTWCSGQPVGCVRDRNAGRAAGRAGAAIVVAAAMARLLAPHAAVVVVGLVGGLGMTGLGGWRMRWRR